MTFTFPDPAKTQLQIAPNCDKFICSFCHEQLEPKRLHYCKYPASGEKRCTKCKAHVPINAVHSCTELVTRRTRYDDPDLEEIDRDVETKISAAADVKTVVVSF